MVVFNEAIMIEDQHTTTDAGPVWVRLPQQGKSCPYTGLRRGQMLKLASNKSTGIRFVHLREQEAKRGTRLIDLKSLLSYLDRCAEGGKVQDEAGSKA